MDSSSRTRSLLPRNDTSSIDVALSESTKPNHLIRHPVHYYFDGSFIFIVENYIFRIYQGLLARRSEVFRDLFHTPQAVEEPSNEGQRYGEEFKQKGGRALDCQGKIDGVPAVRLDDKAADFAALLDIIMPDKIREAQNFTFDKLSVIYTLCDKYIIDDIREWALSWLNDILPTSEDDICKMGEVYTSASIVARVIAFSQDADLPQFLPLAYYAMATYPWSKDETLSSFLEAGESLSEHDGFRIEVGRNAIQVEVLRRVFGALPDIGLPGRSTCIAATVNGGTCAKVRHRFWSEPAELVAEVLRSPLECLDRRMKTPPRNWCSGCTMEAVTQAALMRHALYEKLSRFFLLSE